MSMVTPVLESAPAVIQPWIKILKAAMAETDRKTLPSRINGAESALARRAHELFAMSGNNTEEREAIDRGLHKLQASKYCLKPKNSYGYDRQKRPIR